MKTLITTLLVFITISVFGQTKVEDCDDCPTNCINISLSGEFPPGSSWALYTPEYMQLMGGSTPYDGNLCLPDGCYIFQMQGNQVTGWDGATAILSNGYDTHEIYYTFTLEDSGFDNEVISVNSNCAIGCSNAQACNYDPEVVWDDGSCEYPECEDCPGDLNDDNQVDINDVLAILAHYGNICN